MRTSVFGERVEQVDLLPLRFTPSAGQVEVLLFDVQDHHGFLVLEQIGDDDTDAFARARRRREDDELLAGEADELSTEFAYDNSIGGFLK